jgi:hypothetical protein
MSNVFLLSLVLLSLSISSSSVCEARASSLLHSANFSPQPHLFSRSIAMYALAQRSGAIAAPRVASCPAVAPTCAPRNAAVQRTQVRGDDPRSWAIICSVLRVRLRWISPDWIRRKLLRYQTQPLLLQPHLVAQTPCRQAVVVKAAADGKAEDLDAFERCAQGRSGSPLFHFTWGPHAVLRSLIPPWAHA